jgi:hypothetical protein
VRDLLRRTGTSDDAGSAHGFRDLPHQ